MSKFKKIIIDKKNGIFKNIEHIPPIINLYEKYSNYLNDDYFSRDEISNTERILNLIEKTSPFFWAIVTEKEENFAGFVFLDGWTGSAKQPHCAEITTCFKSIFWGSFTKQCAKKFIKYCFKKYKLQKIKACIFPQNFKVKAILKRSGFQKEAVLKGETMRNGQMQDIEVFSIIRKRGER